MLFHSHWLRYHLEQLAKRLPNQIIDLEPGPDRALSWPDFFDLTARPWGMPALPVDKRPDPPVTRPTTVIGTLCFHQMAVEFGVRASRVAHWTTLAKSGKLLAETLALYDDHELRNVDALARRMALHERMCGVPYHVAALTNGDVVYVNDVLQYTYHGNGSNRSSIAVAVEGLFPGIEAKRAKKHSKWDGFAIETARAAADVAMFQARAANVEVVAATAHRVYSDGRMGDPGQEIWRDVVLWAVDKYKLKVDYGYADKHNGGRPIPNIWDPNALYDYRGRLIRQDIKEAA